MKKENCCAFFRDSDNLSMGRGIGYCDLGVVWTICDGDVRFCEKPDALIQYLSDWNKREKAKTLRNQGIYKKTNSYHQKAERVL